VVKNLLVKKMAALEDAKVLKVLHLHLKEEEKEVIVQRIDQTEVLLTEKLEDSEEDVEKDRTKNIPVKPHKM
jgi:hypothetical protein